ncbi:FAD-dependent oxidoreductase [Candidatus Uhrbacteria bacterium]|nr:FAD-dependent oxidoreductase [Candidatus Uhrbacteria bacterium]
MKDLIIVGGGAAGLSAALFACRRGLSTLVVAKEIGGQTATTSEIENYPGLGKIEGPLLIERFLSEAKEYGAAIAIGEVRSIERRGEGFAVATDADQFESMAVILAFGKTPRDLSVPGEREFLGKGVTYAFLADAERARGKAVAVIGGGNSALEAVGLISGIASCVYLVHRRADFRGEKILLDRLAAAQNVVTLAPYTVSEIRGNEHVEKLLLAHAESNEPKELSVDMVIPCLGFEPRSAFLKDLVALDEGGRVSVSPESETNVPGLFAAGDITTVPYQQIVISAGEGAKAALSAYHYIQKKLGKRALRVDWGFLK